MSINTIFKILTLVLVTLQTSCTNNSEIRALKSEIETLKFNLDALKNDVSLNNTIQDLNYTTVLFVGRKEYSVIQSDIGYFTAAMKEVSKYANGVKVKINFGNLTAAHIHDLSFDATYGAVDANGSPDYTNAKAKNVTFYQTIRSGSWNSSVIELENIDYNNFGFLRISNIKHKGMTLIK